MQDQFEAGAAEMAAHLGALRRALRKEGFSRKASEQMAMEYYAAQLYPCACRVEED